jgi:hypothetical protein
MNKTDQLAIEEFHPGEQAAAGVPRSVESEPALTISLAPHTRVIADQDGAVVLDIKRNATFGLNPTTSFVWRGLEQQLAVEEIVTSLSAETGETISVVRGDVLEFIQDLRGRRMLVEGHTTFNRKWVKLQVFFLFLLYDLLVPPISVLRRRSLWLIHRLVSVWPVAGVPVPDGRVGEICEAVDAACSWYPKQVKCLQRSVATTLLLRRAGVAAKFVAGAQKLPFEAHAWVEVDGRVINDKPDYVNRFIVFERC